MTDIQNRHFRLYAELIVSPLFVMIYMLLIFKMSGLYPFGKLSVSIVDMTQHTLPLLKDYRDILSGKGALFYSFKNASGMNFYGLIIGIILCPLNLLVLFFPNSQMCYLVNILLILKMSLCALSANICFAYLNRKLNPVLRVLLSVMYPFCGFALMYYQIISWLEAMYLFPLVVMSLYRLIKYHKPIMYLIILTMWCCNFYLTYMLAIAILLFVGIYFLRNRNKSEMRLIFRDLFVYSIIAMLLASFSWLPSIIQTAQSARPGDDSIIKHLTNSGMIGPYQTSIPVLLCTALPFVIILSELVTFRGKRNETHTLSLYMLGLTLIPFAVEPINKMWHTGQYMCFPCRFGYMTIFLSLLCCAFVLGRNVEQHKNETLTIAAVIISCLSVFILYQYDKYIRIHDAGTIRSYAGSLWGNEQSFRLMLSVFAVTLIVYIIIWCVYKKGLLPKNVFIAFLAAAFIAESSWNVDVYIVNAAKKNENNNKNMMAAFDLSGRIKDSDFYRVKSMYRFYNDNFIGSLGYNAISNYTTLNNKTYMWTMKRLGYSAVWMKSGSTCGSRLTDALLSIRYSINGNISHSKEVYGSSAGKIYRYAEYLPMGLLLAEGALADKDEIPLELDRIDIQKYISKAILGEDIITRYKPINKERQNGRWHFKKGETITYRFRADNEQALYFDLFDKLTNRLGEPFFGSMEVYVNGKRQTWDIPNEQWNGVIDLGALHDTDVEINVKVTKDTSAYSFGVFGLDVHRLQDLCSKAKGIGLNVKGSKLVGSCDLDKPQTCFVSLPYQDTFTVRVNGKKIEYDKALSGFISFDLPQGHNDIRISFRPQGLLLGLLMTIIGAFLLSAYLRYRQKLRENEIFLTVSKYTVLAASAVVFIVIYIMPFIVNVWRM